MKKKLIIASLIFISIHSQSQTESETIDYLNKKLALNSAPMVDEPMYLTVRTGEDYGKIIIIDSYISNNLFTTKKFHCEQIDGITTFRPANGKLCLRIVSTKGLLKNKYASENVEHYENSMNIPLTCTDEESMRIKKAFEHLFKINGIKQINNDLFKN